MSTLSKTAFEAKYTDASTGEFATNTSQAITSSKMRDFADDIADSLTFTSSSSILVAEYYLSNAEIDTGNSVPIDIIAAPGVGLTIVPVKISMHYLYSGAGFTGNTEVGFYIDTTLATTQDSTMLTQGSNYFAHLSGIDLVGSEGALSNKALKFKISTGNPGGGGASTVYVKVLYYLMSTSA